MIKFSIEKEIIATIAFNYGMIKTKAWKFYFDDFFLKTSDLFCNNSQVICVISDLK